VIMDDSNIQVVKDMFDRFRAGDGPGFLELLTDDVYWDHRGPAGAPFNRLYEGREAVAGFLEDIGSAEEVVLLDDREYFVSGDRVVCIGFMRFRALSTNKEWESDFAMAMTVRDGQISHWRALFDMRLEADAIAG
jgi:ketosteroid isomerase-like protein